EAGAAAFARFLAAQVGREASVLVEKDRTGRSEHFAPVRLDRDLAPGCIARAMITGIAGAVLEGHLAA
ncbi:MAG: tRNA (N(6)-L-threonylcarbamoyladenosine(37)-C(2))-methylthiotransferase MtaB, partial [Alphaproteobacteria bacterium]